MVSLWAANCWLSTVIIIRKVYRSYKPFIFDFQNSRKFKVHHNTYFNNYRDTVVQLESPSFSWFLWLAFQKVDHVWQKCVSECYGSIVLIQTLVYNYNSRGDGLLSHTAWWLSLLTWPALVSLSQHSFTFVFLRRGIESVQLWSEQKLPRSKHCINENWAFYLTEF